MKKVKFEERLQNAASAFFAAEANENANDLVFANSSVVLQKAETFCFTEKVKVWSNSARQIFLFLPGTFLLYFSTLSSLFFYPDLGFTSEMLFFLLSGSFLCLVGLGNIRNIKNLLIPISIVCFSLITAILISLFTDAMQPSLFFEYSIYLFPFVLMISKLLQSWIEDEKTCS